MSVNINKKELIDMVSDKIKKSDSHLKATKKDIESILDAAIKSINEALTKGKKVSLIGFGSFAVKQRKATIKTNPKDTKKKFQVPAKKLVKFKASEKLNDSLN